MKTPLLPAWTLILTAYLLGTALPRASTSQDRSSELRREVRQMISAARDQVFLSLVHIEVVVTRYGEGREIRSRNQGSGTLISPEGHVLTNYHVTQGGVEFLCTLSDHRKVHADLVGDDPLTDLAVLKLRVDDLGDSGSNLPTASFGNSDNLEIGDYVMAMGSPYSLSRSVTLGIISNTQRVFPPELMGSSGEMELEPGQPTGLFTLWIQHDALINPGNSGGPLVDLSGNIVGINEMGGGAIGFAIPSNLARRVAEDLIQHGGEVPRSWIGVSLRPIEETDFSEGILVDSVTTDSPAAKAGLQTGDVIVSLNDQMVTARFPEEVPLLSKTFAEAPIGSVLRIGYRRADTLREARIRTEKLLRDRGKERALPAWGFTVQQLTSKIAHDLGVAENAGVLVTGVRGGSPAHLAQPSLAPGDLIQAVGDAPVHTLEELMAEYQILQKAESPVPALVAFDRKGCSYVTVLHMRNEKDISPVPEVPKPWIGVVTQPITGELGQRLGAPGSHGYRIARVYPATAAAAAGLRVGDILIALNGESLTPRGPEDAGLLERRIREFEIDSTVSLSLVRQGKEQHILVPLERKLVMPLGAEQENSVELGLAIREVTFFDRDENRWSDTIQGVIAEQIDPVGAAGMAGLLQNDLLQRIDGHEIRDIEAFRSVLASLAAHRPKRVALVFLRGMRSHLQYVEPAWKLAPISQER